MLKNLIAGIFIGFGSILPGISSGVFCISFGIYEKLINSILDFFKDIKKNILFLFPLTIGVLIGLVVFSNILKIIFYKFYMPTCFAFIGLILGTLPSVIKQAKASKITFTHMICIVLSLSFSIYLIALEKNIGISSTNIDSNAYLFLSGFLMSAGIVIPGVSQTVILMLLGIYELYLSSISVLNFSILFPLGLGALFGGLIFLILLNFLFKYLKSYTYFTIVGFIFGSIFVLYPGFTLNIEGLISICLFFICLFIGYKLK